MNFLKHLRRLPFFYFFILLFLFISQIKSNAQLKTNNKTISGSGQFGGTSIIGPKPRIKKILQRRSLILQYPTTGVDQRPRKNNESQIDCFDSGDKQKFIPPTIIKDKNIHAVGQKPYIFPLSKLNEVNQKEIVELNNGFKAHYKRVQQTQKKNSK